MGPRIATMLEKDLRGRNRSASERYVISMCAVIVSSDGDVCLSVQSFLEPRARQKVGAWERRGGQGGGETGEWETASGLRVCVCVWVVYMPHNGALCICHS